MQCRFERGWWIKCQPKYLKIMNFVSSMSIILKIESRSILCTRVCHILYWLAVGGTMSCCLRMFAKGTRWHLQWYETKIYMKAFQSNANDLLSDSPCFHSEQIWTCRGRGLDNEVQVGQVQGLGSGPCTDVGQVWGCVQRRMGPWSWIVTPPPVDKLTDIRTWLETLPLPLY